MTQESIFSDLKVVDLATYIAGPAATTILSDYGADVIKVELRHEVESSAGTGSGEK